MIKINDYNVDVYYKNTIDKNIILNKVVGNYNSVVILIFYNLIILNDGS